MKFAMLPKPWEQTVDQLVAAGHSHVGMDGSPDVLIFHGGPKDFPVELPESVHFVQFVWAGIDALVDDGVVARSRVRWASGKGLYNDTVAESTLALILGAMHQFARVAPDGSTTRDIAYEKQYLFDGSTVAIVGAGGIGAKLIEYLAPFAPRIIAVNRSGTKVEGADETLPMDQAGRVWGRADVVVLLAPLTDDTRGLVDREVLAAMKDTAVLVNVARGPIVDTQALVEALDDGTIAGAALDVTDPEPLPADHPLWALDNCLITPHVASVPRFGKQRIAARTIANWEAFAAGEKMPTEVDTAQGY